MSDIGIVRLTEKEAYTTKDYVKNCKHARIQNVKRSMSRQITRPKMKPAGRRIGFYWKLAAIALVRVIQPITGPGLQNLQQRTYTPIHTLPVGHTGHLR